MIDGNWEDGFSLTCDHCEDEADDVFEEFQDAVDYKMDKDNDWRTIKDKNGKFCDLCPACNTPEIIRKLKGVEDL
jgi:3-methyladenine DNA glycosylase/8-oxoguanine DNA glycosylase